MGKLNFFSSKSARIDAEQRGLGEVLDQSLRLPERWVRGMLIQEQTKNGLHMNRLTMCTLALMLGNFSTIPKAHAQEGSGSVAKGSAPFEFKGHNTVREIQTPAEIKALCDSWSAREIIKNGSGRCFIEDSLAGVPGVKISYDFKNKRLYSVYGQFDARLFSIINDAFTEKYGKPASQSTEEVQNRLGAKFTNVRIMWSFIDGFLTLRRFSSSLDKSAFSFTHIDELNKTPEKPKIDF